MRVGVIGINHKTADLHIREVINQAVENGFQRPAFFDFPHVFLSTCNRLELYFSGDNLASIHTQILAYLRHNLSEEFDHRLYSYFEEECFLHLGRVVAGLDSAILAETEIQGQVRDAYQTVNQKQVLPHEMHFLFQKGLRIGKLVRNQLKIERGLPNLEQAVLEALESHFETLDGRNVFVMGASTINRRVLHHLKRRGLLKGAVSNRTHSRAVEFAKEFDLEAVPWEERERWRACDWVLCGTKAPTYQIHYQGSYNSRVFIDLSVPRNIDPRMGAALYNIDDLQAKLQDRRSRLKGRLIMAEELVGELVNRYMFAFSSRGKLVQGIEFVETG